MVFLGIVCKIKLKYSKELLDYKVKKIQKTVLLLVKSFFPWNEVLKTFKIGSFLISEGILFHRRDPL